MGPQYCQKKKKEKKLKNIGDGNVALEFHLQHCKKKKKRSETIASKRALSTQIWPKVVALPTLSVPFNRCTARLGFCKFCIPSFLDVSSFRTK
jgi:hypothetical protein